MSHGHSVQCFGKPPEPADPPAKIEISAEDHDWLQQLKEQKAQPDRQASPKRQKIDDDASQTFVESLAARDIERMDLDPQLRHLLQTDPDARDDAADAGHGASLYDPSKKTFTTLDLSKTRIFSDQQDLVSNTAVLAIPEESIKSAMLEYHQQSVLPSIDKLWKTCQKFYVDTVASNAIRAIAHGYERHQAALPRANSR